MRRAVARGLARKQPQTLMAIGVDEKAHRKGYQYLTIVSDHDTGNVEYVAEGRKIESLASYYASLASNQLADLKIVAMDMWEPYVQATRADVPAADTKIVFARFHLGRRPPRGQSAPSALSPAPPATG
jgi:transposase